MFPPHFGSESKIEKDKLQLRYLQPTSNPPDPIHQSNQSPTPASIDVVVIVLVVLMFD
jgi:hypothetical protein